MLNTNPEMNQVIKANSDALMGFSKVMISSLTQLISLNLSTTRSSLDESVAAATSLLESKAATPSSQANKANPLAISESSSAYLRSVQDIANEAQEEISQLMTTYLAAQGNGSGQNAGWLKGFDAFNGFGQQFSAFAEANRKAMNDVTSQVANQMKRQPKKPA